MKEFDENVILETPRLILRFLRKEDRHDLFCNISHDPEVLTYFLDRYLEKEEDLDLERWITGALKAKKILSVHRPQGYERSDRRDLPMQPDE